jgi:hypothetical protein
MNSTRFGERPGQRRKSVWTAGFALWQNILTVCLILAGAWTGSAQEALHNLQTGSSAAQARNLQLENAEYTFKYEDFRMLLAPSIGLEWNDNVNISKTNALADTILNPAVALTSSYQLTKRNVLFLDISVGYKQYLEHDGWSAFDLNSSSGTGLSFDLGIKDVTLNFHDWMRYSQGSSQTPTIANTATFGSFQNTAGFSAEWDMNQITLKAGYDHKNLFATTAQFENTTHATEMFYFRPGFRVHPKATAGLEVTAGLTTYEQQTLNNNEAYTAGGYIEMRPGHAFHLTGRAGYTIYQFQSTSQTIATSDQNSWYFGLNLSHQLRDSITYGLDAGHQVQLGTQSDLSENWYVRPNITWRLVKNLTCTTSFFYEHGRQGLGNLAGNFSETYDWYGGEIKAGHPLSKHFSIEAFYRLTQRSSSQPNNGYTQNLVGIKLTYHPK